MFVTHTSDQTHAPKIYKVQLQLNNNFEKPILKIDTSQRR